MATNIVDENSKNLFPSLIYLRLFCCAVGVKRGRGLSVNGPADIFDTTAKSADVFRPVVQSSDAKPFARPSIPAFSDHSTRLKDVPLRSRTDKGQIGFSESQIEEPPPGRRKVVVLALRYGSDSISICLLVRPNLR